MDFHNYYAYGSNLSLDQMTTRCPSAKLVIPAMEYKDMVLCFPHKAKIRNCGVASIKACPGSSVYGTLFSISSDDFIKLDRFEGLGNGYSRRFVKASGNNPDFWYYYSLKNNRGDFFAPSKEYLGLIVEGAEKQNFPEAYITQLKEVQTL
jgi:hypothetical protein